MAIFTICGWTIRHDYQWPNDPLQDGDRLCCARCKKYGGLTFVEANKYGEAAALICEDYNASE